MQHLKNEKMKKIILLITLVVCFASCEQEKTAFIDNTKLFNEYQEKIDIEARLKSKGEKYQKRVDSISRAFQAEKIDFSSKAESMPQKKAQEQYNAIMQKEQVLSQQLQIENQSLQQESQAKVDSLIKKVRAFVKDYGKKNQYSYIFGNTESGSVLYGQEAKDITDAVLKELNESYKQ